MQGTPLRVQISHLLNDIQPFSLHILQITLSSSTHLHHGSQFLLVTKQQFLQVLVQLYLVVKHQQGKVHLVHTLAYMIKIHLRLCSLHVSLLTDYRLLTTDSSSVDNRLTDVYAYTILVFLQTFHIDSHLLVHPQQLVRKTSNITLIGGLCRG